MSTLHVGGVYGCERGLILHSGLPPSSLTMLSGHMCGFWNRPGSERLFSLNCCLSWTSLKNQQGCRLLSHASLICFLLLALAMKAAILALLFFFFPVREQSGQWMEWILTGGQIKTWAYSGFRVKGKRREMERVILMLSPDIFCCTDNQYPLTSFLLCYTFPFSFRFTVCVM